MKKEVEQQIDKLLAKESEYYINSDRFKSLLKEHNGEHGKLISGLSNANAIVIPRIVKSSDGEKLYTQAGWASLLNVSHEHFNRIINGKYPISLKDLLILSMFFEVEPNYLIGKSNYRGDIEFYEKTAKKNDKATQALLDFLVYDLGVDIKPIFIDSTKVTLMSSCGGYFKTPKNKSLDGVMVEGVVFTGNQFMHYLDEIEEGVLYITERFCKNLGTSL